MHARQAIAVPEGRQARAGRDPAGRQPARTPKRWWRRRRRRGWSPWSATRGASTRATSGSTRRSQAGELKIQQMDVQTYFFRRTNMNALGQPRRWTDHLLWHHACHTVDLFEYQTGADRVARARAAGPDPPRARHRDGHVDPAEGARRARSARCRCRSTTTGRSARSSATSATTAPTSRATTTCSTARTARSTSRRSTCR